jgi:hypothetical protein
MRRCRVGNPAGQLQGVSVRAARRNIRKSLDRVVGPPVRDELHRHQLRQGFKPDQGTQILLSLRYQELLRSGGPLPSFAEVGFRAFSQYDEDGILLYLLALAGHGGRRCVEIGCGNGIESNTANLVVNHNWNGLMVDGNPSAIDQARGFFSSHPDVFIYPPKCLCSWVTAENVNSLLVDSGFAGPIDVLSLDIDGIDLWVWKALTVAQPRVVVVEYNTHWRAGESFAVRYDPQFVGDFERGYVGASLSAFVKVGRERGYRLVGCNRHQFNAFFVRGGVAEAALPEVSEESCLGHPRLLEEQARMRDRLRASDWVAV